MSDEQEEIVVRAVRTHQGENVDVYAFFMYGADIVRVADISRIQRDDAELKGFQRKEVRDHVRSIVEFLDSGAVIFPNAITLALSPEVRFTSSRGPRPKGLIEVGDGGTLTVPIRPEGQRAAWIVDGQQRSLALARAKNPNIAVPVVGFVSADLQTHREQFILVNKVKPLSARLINELLPETGAYLPRDLSVRRIPSELVNWLNRRPGSPFKGIIRRISDGEEGRGVVVDTALISLIKTSINSPLGALSPYKGGAGLSADLEAMYQQLAVFWQAAKEAYPDAWGLPPTKSRLMHSAGIQAMGFIMDRVMARTQGSADQHKEVLGALRRIRPHCAWTKGNWNDLNLAWDEVQNVPRHIRGLADLLIRFDYEANQGRAG